MNFPTLNTYEAQIIVLLNHYDYDIIELVKKHKKVLRKNNFNSNFFLKIENRCPYSFKKHIKELASTQIANWYKYIKRKQCMKKFISLKKINPYINIDLKDYFHNNDFDLFGLEEDLNILFHLYHGSDDIEYDIEDTYFSNSDYSPDFDSDSSIDYPYKFEDDLELEFSSALNKKLPQVIINKHKTDLEKKIWDEEYSLDFDSDTSSEQVPEEVPEPETPNEPEEKLKEDVNQIENEKKENIGYYEWFKSFFF